MEGTNEHEKKPRAKKSKKPIIRKLQPRRITPKDITRRVKVSRGKNSPTKTGKRTKVSSTRTKEK